MCTTVLHGDVCYRTSTPHKSGNKMKEKKKMMEVISCDALFVGNHCLKRDYIEFGVV